MIVEIVGYITNGANAKRLDKVAIMMGKSDILLGCVEQTKQLHNDVVAGRLPQ
jgi:hypothetical protein